MRSDQISLDYVPKKWDKEQESSFIESILLGIPLPIFYFQKSASDKMLVVNGYKQLYTTKRFFSGELVLRKLKFLPQYENKSAKDIGANILHRISCQKVTYNVMRKGLNFYEEFEVLKMILLEKNRYATQEFRNQFHFGPAIEFLKIMTENEDFQSLFRCNNYELANKLLAFAFFEETTPFHMSVVLEIGNVQFKNDIKEGSKSQREIFEIFGLTMRFIRELLEDQTKIKDKKKKRILMTVWKLVVSNFKVRNSLNEIAYGLRDTLQAIDYTYFNQIKEENQLIHYIEEKIGHSLNWK